MKEQHEHDPQDSHGRLEGPHRVMGIGDLIEMLGNPSQRSRSQSQGSPRVEDTILLSQAFENEQQRLQRLAPDVFAELNSQLELQQPQVLSATEIVHHEGMFDITRKENVLTLRSLLPKGMTAQQYNALPLHQRAVIVECLDACAPQISIMVLLDMGNEDMYEKAQVAGAAQVGEERAQYLEAQRSIREKVYSVKDWAKMMNVVGYVAYSCHKNPRASYLLKIAQELCGVLALGPVGMTNLPPEDKERHGFHYGWITHIRGVLKS